VEITMQARALGAHGLLAAARVGSVYAPPLLLTVRPVAGDAAATSAGHTTVSPPASAAVTNHPPAMNNTRLRRIQYTISCLPVPTGPNKQIVTSIHPQSEHTRPPTSG
jgi:hypothetical protein